MLKKFFKKFFDIDSQGNSALSVLNDVVENNDSLDGGGSDGDFFIVTFTKKSIDNSDTLIADKDISEIDTAMKQGQIVIGQYHPYVAGMGVVQHSYSFITFSTGTYGVVFNGITYMTQNGSEWTKMS